MNNWDIYQILNYLVNKNQAGNTFTPSEFELILNHSSKKLFKRRLGLPEEYQLGSTLTQQGYALTTRMLMDLSDFVVTMDGDSSPNLTFVSGSATIPQYLLYPVGMIYKLAKEGCDEGYNNVEAELVSEAEYMMRKTSDLKKISFSYPIYRFVGNTIKIMPKEITTVDFSYLKTPVEAIFATTTNGTTGEVEYDAASSTELEWNDLAKLDIISIILSSVGLNLRSNEILQIAEAHKNNGL